MQLIGIHEHGPLAFPHPPAQAVALLVDPDPLLLEAGKRLLYGSSISVQTACACVDVSRLPLDDEPQIAVLSERLGSFQLLAVAEYIRHRWPHAKIAVAGRANLFLEDHLYDEAFAEGSSNLDFLAAVERCARQVH
jgi:hypothetical protein